MIKLVLAGWVIQRVISQKEADALYDKLSEMKLPNTIVEIVKQIQDALAELRQG
jgi:hypothetical protein